MQVETDFSFLRLPAVLRQIALSKSSLYGMISEDLFPKPYRLSERVSAWKKSDVDAWCSTRTQALSDVRPIALKREQRAAKRSAAGSK
ncbi:AlpA family transcriptional regulator [Granulicella sp. S190]|uniref:helix-turn-helix transcriptional regulator n=1 Tax=Granulicella sp. S190 TaxID=1747226 RepID=UPI00131A760C|nr:AlpA family phage regulatory protein [Granulicella sp. S190]